MADNSNFLLDLQKQNAANCSGFLKAVLKYLSISFTDKNADGMIDDITSSSTWIEIGAGKKDGVSAIQFARQGYLVVALLKAKEHINPHSHGHVSVVLPMTGPRGYPMLVSGSIVAAGQSRGEKEVQGVWQTVDAPNVHYYRTMSPFPALISAQK